MNSIIATRSMAIFFWKMPFRKRIGDRRKIQTDDMMRRLATLPRIYRSSAPCLEISLTVVYPIPRSAMEENSEKKASTVA